MPITESPYHPTISFEISCLPKGNRLCLHVLVTLLLTFYSPRQLSFRNVSRGEKEEYVWKNSSDHFIAHFRSLSQFQIDFYDIFNAKGFKTQSAYEELEESCLNAC